MVTEPGLPQVSLTRGQWIRVIVVGILAVIALLRIVPDLGRVVYPLRLFAYQTNGDGVVISTGRGLPNAHKPAIPWPDLDVAPLPPKQDGKTVDHIRIGDRIRLDRYLPELRKPGLTGRGFTYDNPDRYLPIERYGHERVLHLVAVDENVRNRAIDILRIVLAIAAVVLGAILFLVKPSIATAAFFVFCLGGVEAPSTLLDSIMPDPYRQIVDIASDTLRGFIRPALLLFALCLIDGDTDVARERVFAWVTAAIGLALGLVNAYAGWRLNYAALPAESLFGYVREISTSLAVMTGIAFTIAFLRARRRDRERIGWIVGAFLFAGGMRLISDAYYPAHIPVWLNSILVSMAIVPIVVVWVAVIRHRFFNVDFVVSRAVVYVALSAAAFGAISVSEEVIYYAFYQYADFAYLLFSLITLGVAFSSSKIVEVLVHLVDRFIFRDRREQRRALEFIGGYILDAETVDDVYRALLQDAAHALKLSFGGILARRSDGSYQLAQSYNWPKDITITLGEADELTRAITRSRGALTFTGKDTRLIQKTFPNERLAFAAPLFFDRTVSGIVVYGHNVSGLDLDPEERELLVRVVAHASIALNAIELNRYRNAAAAAAAPLPSAT
ncbi:MAG TPA: GAF domain-containing protein [Candidatus Elarobacter sp.]|nr:GAF domain-containing protein [Candidatus Elarobacter sp.]